MKLFKPYSNIKSFLRRFTIIQFGPLHIRLHWIDGPDKTTLYHTHPFSYISLILRGGYTDKFLDNKVEKVKIRKILSLLFRKSNVYHRIENVLPNTLTLIFCWGNDRWKLYNTSPVKGDDGIFQRNINNKIVWSKLENGLWYIGSKDKYIAQKETRFSIHQTPNLIEN